MVCKRTFKYVLIECWYIHVYVSLYWYKSVCTRLFVILYQYILALVYTQASTAVSSCVQSLDTAGCVQSLDTAIVYIRVFAGTKEFEKYAEL